MTWSRDPWASVPYGSGEVIGVTPPGTQIPPGIPGGTTSYTYNVQRGAYPWGMLSWAGGLAAPTWPGGGIIVVPDAEAGVMRITAWWPDAPQLHVIRLTPDGGRTPVRGGYPLFTNESTRRNWCTNPSVEVGLNGYVAGTGTPTLSQVVRTDGVSDAGAFAGRAVNASAGTTEITVPHALPSALPFTISLDLKFGSLPTGVTISVGWTDSIGGALSASSVVLTSAQINQSVNQFARQVAAVTPPPLAAVVGSIKVTATGMPAAGVMEWDRVLFDPAGSATYFDGATLGAAWNGTVGLSASLLAPVLTVADGEAPMDIPIYYEVHNPALTGGRMTSTIVTLDSLGRTWLTHPATPSTPLVVQLSAPTPARTYEVDQGAFYAIGRARPIVVSSAQRHAATGALVFGALSRVELRALLAEFADLSPVLLRVPGDYDPGDMWVALGALTVDPQGRLPYQETRLVSAPYFEVDPPDAALVA